MRHQINNISAINKCMTSDIKIVYKMKCGARNLRLKVFPIKHSKSKIEYIFVSFKTKFHVKKVNFK